MNSSKQFVSFYPNTSHTTFVVHSLEQGKRKCIDNVDALKNVKDIFVDEAVSRDIFPKDKSCCGEEDCEWKRLIESCSSCKLPMDECTPCKCVLPQCVCNKVKPMKKKKYNSLYKRVVYPSYEAMHRKRWWGQTSKTHVHKTDKYAFLKMNLNAKSSEFLNATSLYKLPKDSDDDDEDNDEDESNCDCKDHFFTGYISRESLDLSGRKRQKRDIKAKDKLMDPSKFGDELTCFKELEGQGAAEVPGKKKSICLHATDINLPGLLLDMYCPETKKRITEKLMIMKERKDTTGFCGYILKKHFKKKTRLSDISIDVDMDPDPCRLSEIFTSKKKKKKKKKKNQNN